MRPLGFTDNSTGQHHTGSQTTQPARACLGRPSISNSTQLQNASLSACGVFGFLNQALHSVTFNCVHVAADGSCHSHDCAPLRLLTLAICTSLFTVRAASAKWHDKATIHASSSRRLRTHCTCRVRRVPACDSTRCALRLRMTPQSSHCGPMESTAKAFD